MKLSWQREWVFRFRIQLVEGLIALGILASRGGAAGCDLCGCYTPQLDTLQHSVNASALGLPDMEQSLRAIMIMSMSSEI